MRRGGLLPAEAAVVRSESLWEAAWYPMLGTLYILCVRPTGNTV